MKAPSKQGAVQLQSPGWLDSPAPLWVVESTLSLFTSWISLFLAGNCNIRSKLSQVILYCLPEPQRNLCWYLDMRRVGSLLISFYPTMAGPDTLIDIWERQASIFLFSTYPNVRARCEGLSSICFSNSSLLGYIKMDFWVLWSHPWMWATCLVFLNILSVVRN